MGVTKVSPEEKAKEFIERFGDKALDAVTEILDSVPMSPEYEGGEKGAKYKLHAEDYWNDVQTHIKNFNFTNQ